MGASTPTLSYYSPPVLGGQLQGQRTGYQITSRNDAGSCLKVVLKHTQPPWAALRTLNFDLAFDLGGEIWS